MKRITGPGGIVSAVLDDRRRFVSKQLRALGDPHPARRTLPPEGQLSADELRTRQLPVTLTGLGPVFAEFGRYLSSRVDLLPRRQRLELAEMEEIQAAEYRQPNPDPDVAVYVQECLGNARRRFHSFDPLPRAETRWTRQFVAQIPPSMPVAVTVVRPDAARLLDTDLPLLPLLGPWLDIRTEKMAEAVEDFSRTLRQRLDLGQHRQDLNRLADDARTGGGIDAPECFSDYCAAGVLTTERIGGVPIAHATDRVAIARQLASAWIRQAVSGRVVPFDFDLHDIRLLDDRLILMGGALESHTEGERTQFLRYLAAAATDDPDAAWDWLGDGATQDLLGQSEYRLRGLLRQAVPFRDGEWSGEDRIAERLLVQWRTLREAGWSVCARQLHLYRGIQSLSAAITRLAPNDDALLAALRDEQLRLGLDEVRRVLDPRTLPTVIDRQMRDMVQFPKKLDEILTAAAEGRLRVKLNQTDAVENRRARNRTVSLVASLVTMVGLALIVRHLAPAYGADVERIGAILLLIVGGWLLVAAARL